MSDVERICARLRTMHEEMVLASLELGEMENRPTVCTRPRH